MKPLVSVIVPCYNVDTYIQVAIESLIANDYSNKQLIFVDDGSTDGTLSILYEYKERYPDIIEVIKKVNGGVSSARNIGLDYANGEYIMFADPDDKVSSTFIETATKAMDTGVDLVAFGYEENIVGIDGGGKISFHFEKNLN